jgi:hypothetical protein
MESLIRLCMLEDYDNFIDEFIMMKDNLNTFIDDGHDINILMFCCRHNKNIRLIKYIVENTPEQLDFISDNISNNIFYGRIRHNWLTYLIKYNSSLIIYDYFYKNYYEQVRKIFINDIIFFANAGNMSVSNSMLYPYFILCQNNPSVEVFKYILRRRLNFDISTDIRTVSGATGLMLACNKNNNIDVIEYLLSLKNDKYFYRCYTDIDHYDYLKHAIIYNKNIELIKKLFSNDFFKRNNIVIEKLQKGREPHLVSCFYRRDDKTEEVFNILLDNDCFKITERHEANNIVMNNEGMTICSYLSKTLVLKYNKTHINKYYKIMARKKRRELLDIVNEEIDEVILSDIKRGVYDIKKDMIHYRKFTRSMR